MIEVEKKFILTNDDKARLIEGTTFIKEYVFEDSYYDNELFSLSSKDVWLRNRNGKFELKVPLHKSLERSADQYNEIEDENKIKKFLKLHLNESVEMSIKNAGYFPFCTYKTTRKKYKKDMFVIDIDYVEFDSFTYDIGEIELMVNNENEMKDAIEKILDFAKSYNLTIAPVRGKVIEYLKRVKPQHYQALITSGVIKEFN